MVNHSTSVSLVPWLNLVCMFVYLCVCYALLFIKLCEQLHTVVDNVMRLFFDCPKLRKTRARCR